MRIILDPNSLESYRKFIAIKQLPAYRIRGRLAEFPAEYADRIGAAQTDHKPIDARMPSWMFDYQAAVTKLAIRKQKFAIFADCGLGKTAMLLEFARFASSQIGRKRTLIVSPLMVINQTIGECDKFFGNKINLEPVAARDLGKWTHGKGRIGITNYEALSDGIKQGNIGAIILDESSMLKSHYGKWGAKILEIGRGVDWKLCCTGTPAPNDRIEYANHAVFLDHFPTVNSFLATFFVNRGQTDNRWELKAHAIKPFYVALSHWCIFLNNPATYGWSDHSEDIPPINVRIHDVDLTNEQREIIGKETGELFATKMGGITSRSVMGQIAKGHYKGRSISTNKPAAIRGLLDQWPSESTVIWCIYNEEQKRLEREIPEAMSITGATPYAKRMEIIEAFKSGKRKVLISKPKILGFGLNLQIATRQIFSGLQDSYESYYQAVKRSNRVGSTRPLNVHIPLTDVEQEMVANVLRKANRVQRDTDEQEKIFRQQGIIGI